MTKKTMSRLALVVGILCILFALVILGLADGLRRWYSGLFFALLGIVMLINAVRWRQATRQ
jgi:hypothetical protein